MFPVIYAQNSALMDQIPGALICFYIWVWGKTLSCPGSYDKDREICLLFFLKDYTDFNGLHGYRITRI